MLGQLIGSTFDVAVTQRRQWEGKGWKLKRRVETACQRRVWEASSVSISREDERRKKKVVLLTIDRIPAWPRLSGTSGPSGPTSAPEGVQGLYHTKEVHPYPQPFPLPVEALCLARGCLKSPDFSTVIFTSSFIQDNV